MIIIGSVALAIHQLYIDRAAGKAEHTDTLKRAEFPYAVDLDVICRPEEIGALLEGDRYKKFSVKFGDRDHLCVSRYMEPVINGVHKRRGIRVNIRDIDVEVAYPDTTTSKLLSSVEQYYGKAHTHTVGNITAVVPPADFLLALKGTHKFARQSNFTKTRGDILALRKALDVHEAEVVTDPVIGSLLEERRAIQEGSHPNLNVASVDFFKNSFELVYKYDHDSLHEVVKLGEQCAYVGILKCGAEVMCSREKFFALPAATQLNCVLEEAYVLALERSLIPHSMYRKIPTTVVLLALEKICTGITSGWFRTFAWENFDAIVQRINQEGDRFYNKFLKAESEGTLLPAPASVLASSELAKV